MKSLSANIEKPVRVFLPENFIISDWNSISSYFEDLALRPLQTPADLEKWLKDMSELESVISEDVSWRHIRMTCNTEDKKLQDHFTYFMMEVQPKIQPYADLFESQTSQFPFNWFTRQAEIFYLPAFSEKKHRTFS
ncbi:MAG: hypothetical protein WDM78_15360 [Puia sp.]